MTVVKTSVEDLAATSIFGRWNEVDEFIRMLTTIFMKELLLFEMNLVAIQSSQDRKRS